MATNDPELIIGLVAPLGTSTTDLTKEIRGSLSRFGYKVVPIKLSELLPTAASAPTGEAEDQRIQRLIEAGNQFCKVNEDAAVVARLAISAIRARRIELIRADGDHRPIDEIAGRPRTAYVVQSLKRREEVQLLREVYGSQFILIGSQGSVAERTESLLQLNLSSADDAQKDDIVKKLIDIDADEREQLGQNVNRTYPQADFFIRNNDRVDINRVFDLLLQKPEAPTIGEYAMYVALASSARSLAASRKVGAAIVVDDAVVATGYNDVPHGQIPDVLEGEDTSETFKRENAVYGLLAAMMSMMAWMTSSPPTPRIAAPRISSVCASTTTLMKPSVWPFSIARPTRVIGRLPTNAFRPDLRTSSTVMPARPSGGSIYSA